MRSSTRFRFQIGSDRLTFNAYHFRHLILEKLHRLKGSIPYPTNIDTGSNKRLFGSWIEVKGPISTEEFRHWFSRLARPKFLSGPNSEIRKRSKVHRFAISAARFQVLLDGSLDYVWEDQSGKWKTSLVSPIYGRWSASTGYLSFFFETTTTLNGRVYNDIPYNALNIDFKLIG